MLLTAIFNSKDLATTVWVNDTKRDFHACIPYTSSHYFNLILTFYVQLFIVATLFAFNVFYIYTKLIYLDADGVSFLTHM